MAWEATALDLLEAAGIRTSWHRLTQVGNRSVLILRRFDRTRAGGRIGCISAMTAIGTSGGEQRDWGDLTEAVRDLSNSPVQGLRELYDRIVASLAWRPSPEPRAALFDKAPGVSAAATRALIRAR